MNRRFGTAQKEWQEVLTIEKNMVRGIESCGMVETWIHEEMYDRDDLHIAIELISGNHVVIPANGRMVIDTDGSIVIEILV